MAIIHMIADRRRAKIPMEYDAIGKYEGYVCDPDPYTTGLLIEDLTGYERHPTAVFVGWCLDENGVPRRLECIDADYFPRFRLFVTKRTGEG